MNTRPFSPTTKPTAPITLEQTDELMSMLTGGDLPDGYIMPDQPKLTPRQAFSVVWFLQERLGIIPDTYEMCQICEELYDSEHGGCWLDTTDELDEWHIELGVTSEMFKSAAGGGFCSSECEAGFWIEKMRVAK